MDIQPTAKGHLLIIPKYHGAKLHNLPDEYLADLLPVAKRLAIALNLNIDSPQGDGYNILQNNGRIAHQVVDHVHVHLIPKRDEETGLIVGWPSVDADMTELGEFAKELQAKLNWYSYVPIELFYWISTQMKYLLQLNMYIPI